MRPQDYLRPYFDRHSTRLDAALLASIARPILLEPGRWLQFEVCPYFYRIVLTDTEEEILPDGWLDLPSEVLELVEAAGGESPEAETEFLVEWLADGWERVGGQKQYSPASAFYHGYNDGQFDLEQRRWLSAEEAFGE